MIATAAEANPTCFSPTPLKDLELTFVPSYIRLVGLTRATVISSSYIVHAWQGKYLDNHWSSTKFCATQFHGQHENASRAELKALREAIVRAKGYEDMAEDVAPWTGEQEFAEIVAAIERRGGQRAPPIALQVAPVSAPAQSVVTKDDVAQDAVLPTHAISAAVLGLDLPPPASAEVIAVQ